ncbi:MAG: ABC transporter permease [Sphingomonadaceae bacterium]
MLAFFITLITMFRLSLTMALRDWRAGELRFLLAALTLSVAALSTVNFFVDRLSIGFERDAHQVLAADLLLDSDLRLGPEWRAEASRRGLRSADTVTMLTMASVVGQDASSTSTMVALKAVSDDYPLRGHVKLRGQGAGATDVNAPGAPLPGTVWIDGALQASMKLQPGAMLHIGETALKVSAVIAAEPDAAASYAAIAPRVMMSSADLPATQLLQQHALATHRWLLAGDATQVSAFEQWLRVRIAAQPHQAVHIETLAARRGERRSTLDQAQQFLALVGLMTALLSSVAVAMAARRFMQRHHEACAVLRALGMRHGQLARMFLLEFLLVGLAASVAGVALGFGAHFVLLEWLGKLMATELPAPRWQPALQGVATGLVLLLGFALPPLLQLRDLSQVRLLRDEAEAPQARTLASYVAGLLLFTGLLIWQTGDTVLGLGAAGGFLLGGLLFALVAWLALQGLRRLRGLLTHAAWRFAITDLQRRPLASIVQVVALALGLTALLLLTVVRSDLLASWQRATPADAPNHFIINIQPDQQRAISELLRAVGAPALHPQTRARLTHVNGQPALEFLATAPGGAGRQIEPRARELVERELDLGQAVTLPAADTLLAGQWYGDQPYADSAARIYATSMAEAMAEILHLKLGDRLRFDVAGEVLELQVTSTRKIDWRARQVSDVFVLHPQAMRGLPYTLSVAAHVPASDVLFASRLSQAFPNLTVFNVSAFLKQLQASLEQAVAAIEFLFAFTLAAGVFVLYAALAGTLDARTRQAALLRALGATRRQLSQALRIELALTGMLAGALAAAGASLASWVLASFVFHVEWSWSPLLWCSGLLVGAVCALAGGWIGLRHVLNQPPLQSLRQ